VSLFDQLCRRAATLGLAVRGAFHPAPGELTAALPGVSAGTLVLLGFTGSLQWPQFASSPEASDGLRDPLDRWSRRMIGVLSREFDAADIYPSAVPPLPFQRFSLRSEPVHPSPIGLLIHPQWGLWHAYRGALLFEQPIEIPSIEAKPSPCEACTAKPCLAACPVQAFSRGSYDLDACVTHVRSSAGATCRERGCLARRACPVGDEFRYPPAQARFHTAAFLRTAAPTVADRRYDPLRWK
jgi:ferredoxin